MEAERARNTSFEHTAEGYVTVEFDLTPEETVLTRRIDPAPFVPSDPQRRAARCELILKMQADGLAKRLEHAHAKRRSLAFPAAWTAALPCWWQCAP